MRTRNANGEPRALTFEQSERAIDLLQERSEAFLVAIREGLEKAAAGAAIRFQWIAPGSHPLVPSLSPARRSKTLGAIYDFAELAFELDGAVTIFRGCVTVCVKSSDAGSDTPYSKFWTRYILVTHPTSRARDKVAENLSPKALIRFEEQCTVLTAGAMKAIAPLYVDIVKTVLEEDVDINIRSHGEVSVLALDTKGGDFTSMFASLQAGQSLAHVLKGQGQDTASQLLQIATPAFSGKAYRAERTKLGELFPPEDFQLVTYESTDADRGLFLAKIEDKRARYVGLTRAPQPLEDAGLDVDDVDDDPFRAAHAASSSVVSGGLVTQIGMKF